MSGTNVFSRSDGGSPAPEPRAGRADSLGAAGHCRIEVLSGVTDGQVFARLPFPVLIGRNRDADVALVLEPSVAGHHARITQSDGACWVEDLGSLAGTRVNGSRVFAKAQLDDGDVITVGRVECEFSRDGAPAGR